MSAVARPVLRGLGLPAGSLTQEVAELVLERVRSDTAAVVLRRVPLGPRATSNRDATLAVHAPPGVPVDGGGGDRSASPDELVALGRLHHRAGNLELAEQCYFAALEANERDESAHLNYALLLEELGELKDGRNAYLWATRVREMPAGWLGVARLESALDRRRAALAPLGRALSVARSLSELLEVGVTATTLGFTEAGIIAFAKAAKASPQDPGLPYAAARLAESHGELSAMRVHAAEALARDVTSRKHLLGDRASVTARMAL